MPMEIVYAACRIDDVGDNRAHTLFVSYLHGLNDRLQVFYARDMFRRQEQCRTRRRRDLGQESEVNNGMGREGCWIFEIRHGPKGQVAEELRRIQRQRAGLAERVVLARHGCKSGDQDADLKTVITSDFILFHALYFVQNHWPTTLSTW